MASTTTGLNKKQKVITDPNAPPVQTPVQQQVANSFNLPPVVPQVTTPTTPAKVPVNQPAQIIRDEAGNATGVIRDGRVFLGLGSKDIQDMVNAQNKKIGTPEGAVEASGVKAQEEQIAAQEQQAATAIQNLGTQTPEQQNRNVVRGEGIIGQAQTAAAGVGGAIAGGLGAAGSVAAIGAGIGALGGPVSPLTVPVGAAIGAIVGGIGGGLTKISYQKKQDVKQALTVYTQAKSNMGWIITETNAGRLSPAQASELWSEQLANINSAERNLKQDTDTNLDRFLSGGSDELSKVTGFKQRIPFLQTQLAMAMLKPNPNSITNLNEIDTAAL